MPAAAGGEFNLGGGDILSYRELLVGLQRRLGVRRVLMPIPFWLWWLMAELCAPLPRPPITAAQVALMQQDNVAGATRGGFADLGITPRGVLDHMAQDLKS